MSETVVRIAARGDGVTDTGRFVAGTAPGDSIEGEIVTPGPHRAAPPCRHFGTCGGCQLQHIDDESYAAFLIDRITGALAEHRIDAPTIELPHLSPPKTRRRATLRAERRGKQVLLGFNESGSHRIVDIRECHILLPQLFHLVDMLRQVLPGLMTDKSRTTVILTEIDGGAEVLVDGVIPDSLSRIEAASGFAKMMALARLSFGEGGDWEDQWMPMPSTVTLGGRRVGYPHAAFLQATADGEAALVAAVRAAVGDAAHVADLFAGLGTFALALPGKVLAVEGARDAAAALLATRRVQVMHRDLFRRPLSATELAPFDAVVLDPPRAGAKDQVAEIARSGVPRVAYVSCNPATFARDARTLIDGGYRLDWIKPVGQFRWSTHVELAAAFSC